MREDFSEEEISGQPIEENDASWSWMSTSYRWIWGLALIVFGGIFLLQKLTGIRIVNQWAWWAIFIIVPGVYMLVSAWERYSVSGELTPGVRRSTILGLALCAFGLAFLFDIDFNYIWPFVLILIGILLILRRN